MCNKTKEFRYRIHSSGPVGAFYAMGDYTRFDALRSYKAACCPDYEIESTMGYAKFNVNTQNYELCNKDDGGVFGVWIVKKHEEESRIQQAFMENDKREFYLPTRATLEVFNSEGIDENWAKIEGSFSGFELSTGPNFKEGDWVSSEYFEGIKQIGGIFLNCNKQRRATILGTERSFYVKNLTLVCGFVKDQEVEVADDDGIWVDGEKFYDYDPNLTMPYLAIDEFGKIDNWEHCRVLQPKYKPYSKLDSSILDEEIIEKATGNAHQIGMIMNIDKKVCIQLYNTWQYNMEQMLELFTWKKDGSACGELIK